MDEGLEHFLQAHHIHADASDQEFSVEAEGGVITIRITRPFEECTPDQGKVTVEHIVDVQALDPDRARISRVAGGVYLPYRPYAARVLETAHDAKAPLLAKARAERGWGPRAAKEATRVYVERYGDALELSRIGSIYCDGSYSTRIDDPRQWYIALEPSADPNEFIALIREYQASLPPQ